MVKMSKKHMETSVHVLFPPNPALLQLSFFQNNLLKMDISTNLNNLSCPDLFEALDQSSPEHQQLKDHKFWSGIPLLNYTPIHLLKDLQLVRFRGMIQDMQDPEIYLESYEVKNTNNRKIRIQNGKYRDCMHANNDEEVLYDSNANVQGERRTLFVVAIPGINPWAFDYEEKSNRVNVPDIRNDSEENTSTSSKKRCAPCENMELDETATFAVPIEPKVSNDIANKRQCREDKAKDKAKSSVASTLGAEYLLNSPIPERPGKACMVKVYTNFEGYQLNSVIDVIGFLSVNPALDGSNIDTEMYDVNDESVNEVHAQNPPPSLIPRLHAIAVEVLPHHNPLLDERFLHNQSNTTNENDMISMQKDLRVLLSLCFFNDELAAEYMLCHLISTIYSRSELQSIGKFSLNIYNLPKELPNSYAKKLYEILELLLPCSHYLPMKLDTLNTAAFVPKKDYETNKLVSGLLQLAPQTHLVLDETQMEQGKLESGGVLAIQNLAHLINNQQMKCNFEYYDLDYNVDIPVFVLSEGRSMLPNDFILPLEYETQSIELMEETLKAARHYLQPERLDRIRRYLTKAKLSSYDMNPIDSGMVQEDFVQMRKSGIIKTVDELHSLLVLSRLLGIARGNELFDKDSWLMAKEMEAKRKSRIENLTKVTRK